MWGRLSVLCSCLHFPCRESASARQDMMVMGRRKTPWQTLLVTLVVKSVGVAGFSTAPQGGAVGRHIGRTTTAAPADAVSSRPSGARTALGATSTDFGEILGDQLASAIVGSPIYPLLISQAKSTMKKSAQVRMPRKGPDAGLLDYTTCCALTTRVHFWRSRFMITFGRHPVCML